METNTVSVRRQGEGDKGVMTLEEFTKHVKNEVNNELLN